MTELSDSTRSDDAHVGRVVASCLWAAWADALGWISELTDEAGLSRRLSGRPFTPVAWRRRVGGRGGVSVDLPAGTWSDDTQLRMAVARCIGPHGFDVEVFAKVELTVWPAYALGGGFASKAAAAAMARPGARWSTVGHGQPAYSSAGGNGAAMRVQPHAWVGRQQRNDTALLMDVMRDTVTTHGHPRALVGAAMQALALSDLVHGDSLFGRNRAQAWKDLLSRLQALSDLPSSDMELETVWLSQWHNDKDQLWREAIADTLQEVSEDLHSIEAIIEESDDFHTAYQRCVGVLDLKAEKVRGSGTRTSLAALAVFVLARRHDLPASVALTEVASVLHTDTDTIGTMAGALLGAVAPSPPPDRVLDQEYLVFEARRLAEFDAAGPTLRHPDLLSWQAPKTQGDALLADALSANGLYVTGLGPARALSEPIPAPGGGFAWQWVELKFGQTLLIKRRTRLSDVRPADRAQLQGDNTEQPTLVADGSRLAASDQPVAVTRPIPTREDRPQNAKRPAQQPADESNAVKEAADADRARRLSDAERIARHRADREAQRLRAEEERRAQAASLEARRAREAERTAARGEIATSASRPAGGRSSDPRLDQVADLGDVLTRAMKRVRAADFEAQVLGSIFTILARDRGPEVAAAFGALVAQEITQPRPDAATRDDRS